jgi:Uma2 family endonuclease
MSIATLPECPSLDADKNGGAIFENGPCADDSLYEVVRGLRVEMPSMGIRSVWLGTRLSTAMSTHVEEHRLGTVVTEALFILDAELDERRRPDLAFVSAATWPLDREIPSEGDWEVVPDLGVEVISPHDLFEKVLAKIQEYFDFGVKQVWVISPTEEKVYIYQGPCKVRILGVEDDLDGGELLPGFRLKLANLFHRP